jgi:hypothetical protein
MSEEGLITVRKVGDRFVTVRKYSSEVPARFSSQLLALYPFDGFVKVFADVRRGIKGTISD